MSDNNLVLSTYRDIIDMVKNGLITDINSAITQGTLEINEQTTASLLGLIDSCVSASAANGYEQMVRITKLNTKTTKKKR